MRVVSGTLGGRNFASPNGHRTHPMSDKMRGALFSALGDIHGLKVLDIYSGSGALGIEAVSRGAKEVTSIEADKDAYETIQANVLNLMINDRMKPTKAFFKSWSNRHPNDQYDLVLADPPYDFIVLKDIERLNKHLKDTGIIALSWPGKEEVPVIKGLDIIKTNSYGDSQLVFYKKVS
jgi:16S rRNA (guanine966-N2)-methyltransferase